MSYVQIIQPNLDTVGDVGYCLSFVEDVFSTPHLGDTATDGWLSTSFPHQDRDFPANLYIPIWFSYYEGGINYGHVAVLETATGRVLSSPYHQDGTHVWFKDINECSMVLDCKYLGWSEDLATIKLVEEGDTMDDKDILGIYEIAGRNYTTVTQENYDYYRGKKPEQLVNDLKQSQEWKDFSYKGSHYDADVKSGSQLKPGKYYVQ